MKALLGYHDKDKGKYILLENGQPPILVDERYEPFLMTSRQFFTEKTARIDDSLRRVPIRQKIRAFKNTLATILAIPGTIAAILYTLEFISSTTGNEILPFKIPAWIINFTFWLAIWGVMILWHETYRTINQSQKIINADQFSEHDLETIKKGDMGFSKLTMINMWNVLSKEAKDLLYYSLEKDQIDVYKMLLYGAESKEGNIILERLNIQDLKNSLKENDINQNTIPDYPITAIRSILVYALEEAVLTQSMTVEPSHIFIALFKVFPILDQYLKRNRQNVELMRYVIKWLNIKKMNIQLSRTFDPDIPYTRSGGIANSWLYGYTYVLNHYSSDLTKEMAQKNREYGIGHEPQLEQAISILSKMSKNNILFIGESGTGKTSMAKGIATRINKGKVPQTMRDMRIIKLDINGLIAGADEHGNLEALIQKSMRELEKAGNTILFIDEIQELVPARAQESQHSVAGIFLPYVLESKFPIIGTITYADYKRYFYSRESLRQSFNSIEVHEVSPQAAFEIILTMLEDLENKYNIHVTFPAILSSIELAQRYIHDRKLPDSAVNIIESACASASHEGKKILTADKISEVVTQQTNIPVEDVSTEEATKLLNLEEKMKAKVIGQDEAVHQVVEALKRARADVRDPNKPIGTFLFLGPTGVGKTHLAKTLSKEYFGSEAELIRLDMSEFKDIASMQKILGSSDISEGAQTATTLLDKVKRNPFATILLDEIEKAHPQVLDLFLQLLDEGRLTSSSGETVTFNNTIIISTSNIGSKILLDTLKQDEDMFEVAKDKVMLELRQKVRVEFLNRFDKIIVFSPHDMENLAKIAVLLLKELKARMINKDITIEWTPAIPHLIASKAHEPGLGARPLRRYIQDHVEGHLATQMLHQNIRAGDKLIIDETVFADDQPITDNPQQQSQNAQPQNNPSINKKSDNPVPQSPNPSNMNTSPLTN